jgi:hypothetical protein
MDTQLFNALSDEKVKLLFRSFEEIPAAPQVITSIVEALYREVGMTVTPRVYIAHGPNHAKELLYQALEANPKLPGKNVAEVLFKHAVSLGRSLQKTLEGALSMDDLHPMKKMIFWDLNFQMAQSYHEAVMRSLHKENVIPQIHGLRPAANPSIADIDWLGWYDIYQRCTQKVPALSTAFYDFVVQGGSWLYAFDDFAIVCVKPCVVQRNEFLSLHAEEEAAVGWEDGSALYFHHGVPIPGKLICTPDSITREDIISETNAEVRRCYQEILGSERFGNLLGLELLDAQHDRFGNDLQLFKTKDRDKFVGNFIYFAQVTCPSTQRNYFICVPPTIRSAKEAVAWSFGKTQESYRPDVET